MFWKIDLLCLWGGLPLPLILARMAKTSVAAPGAGAPELGCGGASGKGSDVDPQFSQPCVHRLWRPITKWSKEACPQRRQNQGEVMGSPHGAWGCWATWTQGGKSKNHPQMLSAFQAQPSPAAPPAASCGTCCLASGTGRKAPPPWGWDWGFCAGVGQSRCRFLPLDRSFVWYFVKIHRF